MQCQLPKTLKTSRPSHEGALTAQLTLLEPRPCGEALNVAVEYMLSMKSLDCFRVLGVQTAWAYGAPRVPCLCKILYLTCTQLGMKEWKKIERTNYSKP